MTVFGALLAHEWRQVQRNQFLFTAAIALPLVSAPFLMPVLDHLVTEDGAGLNGAERALPGLGAMFDLLVVGTHALTFYRERENRTWDRLVAFGVPLGAVVTAKSLPYLAFLCLQQVIVVVLVGTLLGVRFEGTLAFLPLTIVAFSALLVGAGLAMARLCRRLEQVELVQNIGLLVFAGLGGVISPVELLPGWAQGLARVTPIYWTQAGYRAAIDSTHATPTSTTTFALVTMLLIGVACYVWTVASFRSRPYSGLLSE